MEEGTKEIMQRSVSPYSCAPFFMHTHPIAQGGGADGAIGGVPEHVKKVVTPLVSIIAPGHETPKKVFRG